MAKLGDMPVSLVLTRDQVRMLRAALSTTDYVSPVLWDFVKSRDLRTALDKAETLATIEHARSPQEIKERAEIAKVYGPALVDYILKQRENVGTNV